MGDRHIPRTSHFRNVVGDTALVDAVHIGPTLIRPLRIIQDNLQMFSFTCSPAQRTLGIREAGELQGRLAFKGSNSSCCLVTCFAESQSLHFICTRLAAQAGKFLKAKSFSQPCRLLGLPGQAQPKCCPMQTQASWLLDPGHEVSTDRILQSL